MCKQADALYREYYTGVGRYNPGWYGTQTEGSDVVDLAPEVYCQRMNDIRARIFTHQRECRECRRMTVVPFPARARQDTPNGRGGERGGGRPIGTTDIQPAEILAAVECLGGADVSKIARYTGRNRGSLRRHLYRLVEQGQLRKGERGRYYPAQQMVFEGVTGD